MAGSLVSPGMVSVKYIRMSLPFDPAENFRKVIKVRRSAWRRGAPRRPGRCHPAGLAALRRAD